jgi:hypothetical protein
VISAVYNNGEVVNHPWGGTMSIPAIENDDCDWYGNQVNKYELFREMYDGNGLYFGNSIKLPADSKYMLVTSKLDLRQDYSGKGDNADWFDNQGMTWEDGFNDALKNILDYVNNMLVNDVNGSNPVTQEEVYAAIDKLVEETVAELAKQHEDQIDDIEEAAITVKDKAMAYANALCKLHYDLGQRDEADGMGPYYAFFVDKQSGKIISTQEKLSEIEREILAGINEGDYDTEADYEAAVVAAKKARIALVYPMAKTPGVVQNYFNEVIDFANLIKDYDYQQGIEIDQETITIFDNKFSVYEAALLEQIATREEGLKTVEPGDNFYDRYMERATYSYEELMEDEGLEDAFDEIQDDPTRWSIALFDVLPEDVDWYTFNTTMTTYSAWKKVEKAYQEALSTNAKAFVDNTARVNADWAALSGTGTSTTRTGEKGEVLNFKDLLAEALSLTTDFDGEGSDLPTGWAYDQDEYTEAKAAAEVVLRKMGIEGAAFLLYSWAVWEHENGFDDDFPSDDVLKAKYPNYIIARENRKLNKQIDILNDYLAHLYQNNLFLNYAYLRELATEDIAAVETAEGENNNAIAGLKAAIDGEPSGARLNIIWTDRDERNDVVGIMEAVVNGTRTKGGDNAIYNLNGMRVKTATKGIFIQNGKKVIK